ncbi:hypothetical protein PTW35_26140 (plasmid) [Photobacterium sp. DA100]|uniref:hypothetical protein n=1 Tax=Photobacterium sp. DA100 TaxID=3027472 RepID=UPI00247A52DC|nr:hypothetical protein [Photobacterium sp. DA100]WEM44737.1 hypothetical protein PTW35_26140 [Photobacterium sp. DA100]
MNYNNAALVATDTIESPIKKIYVYDIDVASDKVVRVQDKVEGLGGLNQFLIHISQETINSTNSKTFHFNSGSKTKNLLNSFMASTHTQSDETISTELANKLLSAEKATTKKVKQLHTGLKKGTMVICHFQSNNRDCLIISKLDFESFLERDTYTKKLGLPEKNGILKSCVINIENNSMSDNVYLLDSNKSISHFWYDLFLETKPLKDDLLNTKTAFREISRTFVGLSRTSKVDYQQLKNNLISYFSTNSNFTTSDLLDSLIGEYKPVSDKVDLEEIKSKIQSLVVDGKFDGSFVIDDKEIKDKFKQTIKADGGIIISTNKGFNDRIFRKVIDGENYIIIKTNTGLDEVREYPTGE